MPDGECLGWMPAPRVQCDPGSVGLDPVLFRVFQCFTRDLLVDVDSRPNYRRPEINTTRLRWLCIPTSSMLWTVGPGMFLRFVFACVG